MPIFEYSCTDCRTDYEVLHKSSENADLIECPSCSSHNHVKKLSTFAPSMGGSSSYDAPCASGSCGMPSSYSPCAGGACGLG